MDALINFWHQTGFYQILGSPNALIMILVACLLLYLAIVKKFEPLLLLPIAFGMLLTNLIGADMYHEALFAGGHVHWEMFGSGIPLADGSTVMPGLIDVLYLGVKLGIYPCLIFVGVGAMTDFGPLIANPKSLLLGAAAQLGIFMTFIGVRELFPFIVSNLEGLLDGTPLVNLAGSVGIIGGADGPTAIFLTSKLAPQLLGSIAVAAYSYMALVPVIQPPIMKLLTTKKERAIVMESLRPVTKREKIIFPVAVTLIVAFIVPDATPLVGMLMLGNLFRESGVVKQLSETASNALMYIVVIILGTSVGATTSAEAFLNVSTIKIVVLGLVAFAVGTAAGVLFGKLMCKVTGGKVNPLIGSAGVSAVPMAARVSQKVGAEADPSNFLLMHAMGPNVAGVIGTAVAAGTFMAIFGV